MVQDMGTMLVNVTQKSAGVHNMLEQEHGRQHAPCTTHCICICYMCLSAASTIVLIQPEALILCHTSGHSSVIIMNDYKG